MKKNAIVTGAASGFGLEFAKFLAEDSYNLILVDINGPGLKSAEEDFRRKYAVSIECIECDLSKPGSVKQVFSFCETRHIDILINNAGYGLYGFFNKTSWQIEEDMIHLQVLNLAHLTKLVLGKMIERGSGRIMNVSSIAAFQPGPLMAVYYATKAFILSFTQALSNELTGTGVSITAFCPGQTKTNFQQTVATLSGSKLSSAGIFIAELHDVAKYGYDAMMSGKPVAIPGVINKLLVQANRIIPRQSAVSLVRRIQEQVRK